MNETRSRSEMKAAQELPISERPTLSSVPSAIPVALPLKDEEPSCSERSSQLEARISRLLDENRALLNERKQLREIGEHRIQRANECLQHARDARIAIKAYVDARTEVDRLFALPHAHESTCKKAEAVADEAYEALVAFVSKPL